MRGPEALGYEINLWISCRMADLIERECGVKYHPSKVWSILRQLGWSCQRLLGGTLERGRGEDPAVEARKLTGD